MTRGLTFRINIQNQLYLILKRNYDSLILKNWRDIIKNLACIVKKYLLDARVYVFGSVPEDKFTAASDLDILIIPNEANLNPDMLEVHSITLKVFQ